MSSRGRILDEHFVPVRHGQVHTVEVDGEAVLLDEAKGRLHLLNRTGTLVWECLDGKSTMREIVTDLSDGLGVRYEVALADTLAVLGNLADEGLIANVEPSPRADV